MRRRTKRRSSAMPGRLWLGTSPASAKPVRTEGAGADGLPADAPLKVSVAPNELHIQVEAPLCSAPPDLLRRREDVRALTLTCVPCSNRSEHTSPCSRAKTSGTETASADAPSRRGFFGKLRGFFAQCSADLAAIHSKVFCDECIQFQAKLPTTQGECCAKTGVYCFVRAMLTAAAPRSFPPKEMCSSATLQSRRDRFQ